MRWVFFLLLLLNVGLFAWQQRLTPDVSSELSLRAPSATSQPVASLQLLTEAQPVGQQAAVAELATAPAAESCLALGGFDGAERAGQLEQRLLSLDISARVITIDAAFGSDHWVYIPPLASSQASLRQLRELQARGIDSYLITEGELANGILLGVFPRLEAAVGVADKLRAAGYEPQVRELPRVYQQYWVRVASKARRLVDELLLKQLAADFPDLKHEVISCTGVAQFE
ncbi:SPOR domain-containing protein [Pseudomonas sp. GCM10022188]|uniref:SPOR domain-containing protein n=1 Tax=Pseudomonas TaxID=286 RepID=UPI001E5E42E8|nr:SPOR domain-containing protein [Pseudomonas oryzagri]MCC6075385.1 SPOR domain-containing protein [Pseudomonas oryzagri]